MFVSCARTRALDLVPMHGWVATDPPAGKRSVLASERELHAIDVMVVQAEQAVVDPKICGFPNLRVRYSTLNYVGSLAIGRGSSSASIHPLLPISYPLIDLHSESSSATCADIHTTYNIASHQVPLNYQRKLQHTTSE